MEKIKINCICVSISEKDFEHNLELAPIDLKRTPKTIL